MNSVPLLLDALSDAFAVVDWVFVFELVAVMPEWAGVEGVDEHVCYVADVRTFGTTKCVGDVGGWQVVLVSEGELGSISGNSMGG